MAELGTSISLAGTIELGDGSDGGAISGLKIVAIDGGQAVTNLFGVQVKGVALFNKTSASEKHVYVSCITKTERE
ncbi:MAG: hypothetical protein K2Y56_19880 [Methylobacterium sp.]|nr:hypothetical protein [Methylobacterium sp.]